MEIPAVRRSGIHHFPVTALTVFAVTAASSIAGEIDPDLVTRWGRTPAGLHGECWRSLTSLFVQDGGIFGTVSNLLFLLVVGIVAEQFLGPVRWLLQYFGIGVATEFIAYLMQPTGAGNSIAICGLAGAVAVAYLRRDPRAPVPAAQIVTVLWMSAIIGTLGTGWSAAVLVGCALAGPLVALHRKGADIRIPFGIAVVVVGAGLTLLSNIHGVALLLGCAMAVFVRRHD